MKRRIHTGVKPAILFPVILGGGLPAPAAPTLDAPAEAFVGNDKSPTLSWVEPDDPSVVSYTIEIATDSAFTSIVYTGTEDAGTTSHTVSPDLTDFGLYYWRVKSVNAAGSTASATRTLYIEINEAAATITPTLGADMTPDGNMETAPLSNYWVGSAVTLTQEVEERTGGSGTKCAQVLRGAGQTASNNAWRSVTQVKDEWYMLDSWCRNVDASTGARITILNVLGGLLYTSSTSWTRRRRVDLATGTAGQIRMNYSTNAEGQSVRFDDIAYYPITAATMRALIGDVRRSTGTFTCHPTVDDHSQAGLMVNYLDATNHVLMFVDRRDDGNDTAYLLKRTTAAGYSTVITGTVTYVAGNSLEVRVSGTNYSLYYNGLQVGTTQAIADAVGTKVYAFNSLDGNEVGVVETDPLVA